MSNLLPISAEQLKAKFPLLSRGEINHMLENLPYRVLQKLILRVDKLQEEKGEDL